MDNSDNNSQFSQLVMSYGTAALAYLGRLDDPQLKDVPRDKSLAKYNIDILLMLRDKTKGNLSENEAKLLDSLLYDLQMIYLEENN